MLDIDNISVEARQKFCKVRGVWGAKIGDITDLSLSDTVTTLGPGISYMLDLKPADTGARLAQVLRAYGKMKVPPTLVTIPGSLPRETIEHAVANRGSTGIIVNGPLSDWANTYCEAEFGRDRIQLLNRWTTKALEAGAQGITCPGFLLKKEFSVPSGFIIITTGIRSDGVDKGGHVKTITPEAALDLGTLPVIGTEITSAANPFRTLRDLVKRCNQYF